MIGNELLPNTNFPLVFDSVAGECEQEIGDSSYFNKMEVSVVMKWILKLIKSTWKGSNISSRDIGVVSPYKKQCALIRKEVCSNLCEGVSVGTAETFQGQEKCIIIISTVRTDNELGFVK